MLQRSKFSERVIKRVLIVIGLLFLPQLFGYNYIVSFLYELLFFIVLVCLYALFTKSATWNKALIASGTMFVLLGVVIGFFSILGFIKVDRKWEVGNYKVEYIRDQGFAGGPLMKYKLSKYGAVPVFIKELEIKVDDDTLGNCNVYFDESNVVFDKCEGRITNLLR